MRKKDTHAQLQNMFMIATLMSHLVMSSNKMTDSLAKLLEQDLLRLHGPIMTGDHLLKALGYASQEALRQSLVRKTTPVPVFKLEKRRGYFVLVKDVANYLAAQRENPNS